MSGAVLTGRGLRKSYPQPGLAPVEVLSGVDLDIHPGEFVAILGPSGSGKSTLLHLLGLMDEPTAGELRLFDKNVTRMSEAERCAARGGKLGFVFQFDSLLPEFTLLENAAMPGRLAGQSRDAALARARELLSRFGMERQLDRLPRELSGGERQRGAIARALHNGPALVLADEPTGNLDRPNGELVFSDLRRLTKEFGVAVVVVTHNEASAAVCDRAYHLKDGRLLDGREHAPR
jgi:lipoprotein-releasing system ATP-binding protein